MRSGALGPMMHSVVVSEVTSYDKRNHVVKKNRHLLAVSRKLSTCKNTEPSVGKLCFIQVKDLICWMDGDISINLLNPRRATEQSFS